MKVLMIDNFDSFTYNLVAEFRTLGCELKIYRNQVDLARLKRVFETFEPGLIVLSPGPSTPDDAGNCLPIIEKYRGKLPIFGICLGHQCLIQALGGKVERAPEPVHGKKSPVNHNGGALFAGIPSPFAAGRYHSLIGSVIPESLTVTAQTGGVPMAVENADEGLYGVQFHPESILTTHGSRIIQNVLEVVR